MAKVTVTDVKRVPSIDAARIGQTDTLVLYRTDEGRAYYVILAGENPSDPQIRDAIKADVGKRAQLIGREIQL